MKRYCEVTAIHIKKKRRMFSKGGSSSGRDLPPELWLEILARIPVRSLLLLRPMCKLFDSLVPSDPLLADLHLRHRQRHSESSIRRVMVLEECMHLTALQSGVLHPASAENRNAASLVFNSTIIMELCYKSIIPAYRGILGAFGEDLAFVCNPATGQWLCFSKPLWEEGEMLHIGWDTPNSALKVVRLCILKQTLLEQRHQGLVNVPISLACEICTLEEDDDARNDDRRYNNHLRPCWTTLADSTNPLVHISRECFHGDGILCWGVRTFPSARGFTSILTLNLAAHRFEATPLPKFFHSPSGYTTFQELDDHMCIIFWPPDSQGTLEIWMLQDINAVSDRNSWFLRFSVQQQSLSMGGLVDLIAMWDDRIIYTCDKEQRKSMFYYDLHLQEPTPVPWSYTFFGSDDNASRFLSSNLISVYEETLAPVIPWRGAQNMQRISFQRTIGMLSLRYASHLRG